MKKQWSREDYAKLIPVWLQAVKRRESKDWIASQLGITTNQVKWAATYLRSKGVELPRMNPERRLTEEDVAHLNSLKKENE